MATFEVTAIRTDQYKVIIDETIWTEEKRETEFGGYLRSVEFGDISEDLCAKAMRGGIGGYYEAFGFVRTFENGEQVPITLSGGRPIPEEKFLEGFELHIIREDYDYEFETEQTENHDN